MPQGSKFCACSQQVSASPSTQTGDTEGIRQALRQHRYTNHPLEHAFKYMNIVNDRALFRMHARCHARCRITLRTNDVASRLLSAIPIINSNIYSIILIFCISVRCLRCMLGVMGDVETLVQTWKQVDYSVRYQSSILTCA